MKKLSSPHNRPEFCSEIIIKKRAEINVIHLSGKGNPKLKYDKRKYELLKWLENKNVKQKGPPLGIYYNDRDKVGVENVIWDACIPIDREIDDVKYKYLPKARVIATILTGPYSLIGKALQYLEKVSEHNKIKTKWPLTETYIKEGQEPVTELQFFID